MKQNRMKFFLKGIIATFGLAIAVEAFALFGLPLLGIDVNEVASYVSEQINSAKADLDSVDIAQMSGAPEISGEGGPMEGTGDLQSTSDLSDPVNTGTEYTFDETTYPYRALLSSDQQSVYNQIYANALVYNTETFTLVTSLSSDDLCDTMNAVFNDHPELFWLNTSYKYGYNSANEVVQVQLSYGISSSELEEAQSAFDSAVSTIVSGASAYSSEIEKELYIHDAICDLCTYNSNADLNQSAYSALVNGETVCAGYARAFQVVCQNAGLTCYYVTGTASGGDHAWNIISIDGDFYNVDVTWDDSISESYGSSVYPYFNLTDSEISVDHTRSELSSQLPSCTATAMSYTNVYGSTITIDDINNDGGQITDGNFTIETPQEPVTDWRDEQGPANNADDSTAPQSTEGQPEGMGNQPMGGGRNR